MKTTIRRFHEVLPILNKAIASGLDSKLIYAVKKINTQFQSVTKALVDDLQDRVADFNNAVAIVDESGAIIYENAGQPNQSYKYNREDAKKVADNAKKLNNLFLDTEVEIAGYFIDDISDAIAEANKFFDLFDKEELTGILYKPKAMYIITQDYFDQYSDILDGSDFTVGTECTQDEDGTLHLIEEKSKGAQTNGDPNLPPPKHPPVLPL